LFSQTYHANDPTNVDFLATAYNTLVNVAASQNVAGVNFDVSAVAAMNEPCEALEPLAIAIDGTPITFNT